MNETYANILRERAALWGVAVPEGAIDDVDVPRANIVEGLEWKGKPEWQHHARIDLVTLNGLWSYTLHIADGGEGLVYGPFLKFCAPVATRDAALVAAIAAVRRRRNLSAGLLAWLSSLERPQQLGLF